MYILKKKLYRSNDSVICGVCGGIAEYFGLSPWVVRITYLVVAILCNFIPLLVYVPIIIYAVLAFTLPKKPGKSYNDLITLLESWNKKADGERKEVVDAKERDVKQNKNK